MLQKEFNHEFLLAALALCFTEQESSLSIEQLTMRSFTPDPYYSKMCINHLLIGGAIQCTAAETDPISSGGKVSHFIRVERPQKMTNPLHKFIAETLTNLKSKLNSNQECVRYLDTIRQDIESCECIQYAKFFASRDDLTVVEVSLNETNLHLLLLEIEREQVFMLLWRSIKKHCEMASTNAKQVSFSDLVKTALEFYFVYKAKAITIDSYKWPKQIPVSKVSSVIRFLMQE